MRGRRSATRRWPSAAEGEAVSGPAQRGRRLSANRWPSSAAQPRRRGAGAELNQVSEFTYYNNIYVGKVAQFTIFLGGL